MVTIEYLFERLNYRIGVVETWAKAAAILDKDCRPVCELGTPMHNLEVAIHTVENLRKEIIKALEAHYGEDWYKMNEANDE